MNRKEKHAFVDDFTQWQGDCSCMLVIRQLKMDAGSSVSLRRALRQAGGVLRIVKNSLVKKALASADLPVEFSQSFSGPTGVIFAKEPVAAAKVLVDFSKKLEGKFEILVAMFDGQCLASNDVKALSTMPSLEQLRAQLLGLMVAPATSVLRLLKEAQTRAVRILEAHCQNQNKN